MASPPPDELAFNPEAALRALERHGVRCVVVGAYAAQLRGVAGLVTADIDVTPALDADNLQRLAEALHELGATVRVERHRLGPVRLPADGGLLARTPILNLHLPGIGDLDVIHRAAAPTRERGAMDYDWLSRTATQETVPASGVRVLVMSESDWVDAKSTPPVRERDQAHLAAYERSRQTRSVG
jgi:hypothetical protein